MEQLLVRIITRRQYNLIARKMMLDIIISTYAAGADYQRLLTTRYFRPGQEPIVVIQINIIDDSLQEGDERFTVEIQTFDISIILVNAITEIIIEDNEDEGEDGEFIPIINSISNACCSLFRRLHCRIRWTN